MTPAVDPSPTRVVVLDGGGEDHSGPLALDLPHQSFTVVGETDVADLVADLVRDQQPDAVLVRVALAELRASDVLRSVSVAARGVRIVVLGGSGADPLPSGCLEDLLRPSEADGPPELAAATDLGLEAGSVRDARDFVSEQCRRWRCDHFVQDALVVVSELVTNAIRHARTSAAVRVRYAAGVLRVEVVDRSTAPPQPREPDSRGPGGRGLLLVSGLSRGWGVEPLPEGKRVWAALAPPATARPSEALALDLGGTRLS